MINKTVLANGVRLLSERIPHAFSVTLGMWVEVGSRDEDARRKGASHFIEHMAFKGTTKRNALEIAREIDLLGGMANAFTSKENTCFHARALSDQFPRLSDLMLDLFLSSTYDPMELERERLVILQEISCVEDTPDELVHVLFSQNFWGGHPLGSPILGTVETVSSMNRQSIMDYQRDYYHPESIVISAVGDIDHEHFVDIMSGPLSALKASGPKPTRNAAAGKTAYSVKSRPSEQVHVVMGVPSLKATHPDRFTAALLNQVLGGNMSSRLFQEVREKRGLAYTVYSFLNAYSDSGMIGVYMGVPAERTAEAIKVVRGEMNHLAENPISAQELSDAKNGLKGSILLAMEGMESRMSRLARNEFNYQRIIPIKEVIKKLEAVTQEDIHHMAQTILTGENQAVTVLGPVDEDKLPEEKTK